MENMDRNMKKANYQKMALMLLLSFLIMYAVMFFNVDSTDHIYLSTTRFYMALLMVAPMPLLMLTMMKMMYMDKKLNTIIMIASILVFLLSFILLRTQKPIGDEQYMKAMIPHHSSAIMTSKNAAITDPEVKELSEKIIRTQVEEIAQMKAILKRLD